MLSWQKWINCICFVFVVCIEALVGCGCGCLSTYIQQMHNVIILLSLRQGTPTQQNIDVHEALLCVLLVLEILCFNARLTSVWMLSAWYFCVDVEHMMCFPCVCLCFIVRRAGLLWSQQDFEWRWSVPLFKCFTVLEFSFILFDLCLLITFFNFIMNYVPIVTFWIFTYHKIWILSIMFCSIWSYWIIYFLACLEVSWRVVS